MERTCESCGHDGDDDLESVHRVYVKAEGWREVSEAIEEGRVDVVPESELWCFACRSQYPHVPEGDST